MDVGVLLVFQNWFTDNLTDEEVFRDEAELGVLAEQYGFDSVWSAEHHFDDYSMCPDNLQLMSLPGRRAPSRIKLGTGAVILPWNDPLRVVEKVTMLDHPVERARAVRHGPRPGEDGVRGLRVDMGEARASASTRPPE